MDKNICKMVLSNRQQFVPSIFTIRQVSIVDKYLNQQPLTNTEKTYLYSTIKSKIKALSHLHRQYHVNGREMITVRMAKARDLLDSYEKTFVSGSFLYANDYNDIDIYIISNRRKQYRKGRYHFVHITEEDLKKPIINSALNYSISNFPIEEYRPVIKRPSFSDLITVYELAINEILDDEDHKTVRDIIFEYHLQVKGKVLDSYELYLATQEILATNKKRRIETINDMVKETLLSSYSHRYLYDQLLIFLRQLERNMKVVEKNDNLIIYHGLLEEVKDECRRAEA